MKRTLYIHAGPSKTGTSALQHVLSRHDNSVVIYPKVGLWADGSHHNLVLNVLGGSVYPEFVPEDADVLLARIRAEANLSDKPIVISSEILSDEICAPDRFVQAMLAQFGHDFRAEILFTVRQHYSRAKSLYTQCIVDPFIADRRVPDDFLSQNLASLCYAPLLGRLQKAGCEIRLLRYEPSDEFVPSVMRHVGFPPDSIPPSTVRHESPSTMAAIALLVLNRFAASPELRKKITGRIVQMRNFHGPSRPVFGEKAMLAAAPAFRDDREFLLRQFGFDLPAAAPPAGETGFWLSEAEYAQVAEAVADLDGDVGLYCEILRGFVRRANS